jgi:hypothetical protein
MASENRANKKTTKNRSGHEEQNSAHTSYKVSLQNYKLCKLCVGHQKPQKWWLLKHCKDKFEKFKNKLIFILNIKVL